MSGENSTDLLKGYLTIVPSGLECVASNFIRNTLEESSYACHELKILRPTGGDEETIDQLKEKLRLQNKKRDARKKRKNKRLAPTTKNDNEKTSNLSNNSDDAQMVGTLKRADGTEVSMGYHNGMAVTSNPGPLEGTLLLQFHTNAPARVVASIRGMGCGPLLAIATTSLDTTDENNNDINSDSKNQTAELSSSSQILSDDQTLEEAIQSLSGFLLQHHERNKNNYTSRFRRALSLWFEHAHDVWYGTEFYKLDCDDTKNDCIQRSMTVESKFKGKIPFKYRISCLRSHTKRYGWKREDIIAPLADQLVPVKELSGVDLSDGGNNSNTTENTDTDKDDTTPQWQVDLRNYDFEVLTILHTNSVTVAIPLRPYQYLSAKTYSQGRLPPDVTPPYIIPVRSCTIRLRPSTAALLLHLAKLQPGDVVFDPCAGMGTIPIETSMRRGGCIGLGGDVVLTAEVGDFIDTATEYLSAAVNHAKRQQSKTTTKNGVISELMASDAAMLPIRDGSVDCIVSDLPFGQKCLSSSKLSQLLPLFMFECARVLRPDVGRVVFLCGSYQGVLDALTSIEYKSFDDPLKKANVFIFPCTSVFPVNIGGLTAWIIVVKRGNGTPMPIKDHRTKARKIAGIRKRVEESEKNLRARNKSGAAGEGPIKVKTGKAKAQWIDHADLET